MFRLTTLVGILFLTLATFGLFQIKFKVNDLNEDLTEIEKQITEEQEALHILKAEWTYLTKPERIKTLAIKYLDLNQIQVAQVKHVKSFDDVKLALAPKKIEKNEQIVSNQSIRTLVRWNYKENKLDRSKGNVIKAKL